MSAFVDIVYPSRLFVSSMCYNLCLDNFFIYIIHLSFLILVSFHADLDVSDIENLQLQKEQHEKNIEGMNEAITKFRKKQRQLEDEEANIHKQKVPSILIYSLPFSNFLVVFGDSYLLIITFSRKKLSTR